MIVVLYDSGNSFLEIVMILTVSLPDSTIIEKNSMSAFNSVMSIPSMLCFHYLRNGLANFRYYSLILLAACF